jgi:6-phosphogluconate dehydrogenase
MSDSTPAALNLPLQSIAMLGLGKMGGNMARRMAQSGIRVAGFDASPEARQALAGVANIECYESLAELVAKAQVTIYWSMLPAGDITENTLNALSTSLKKGDLVVEGGNSNYLDSQRRSAAMQAKGIDFLDCGVSGGVWGLTNGYCLSAGGSERAFDRIKPYIQALAPTPDRGWLHVGATGSGHFVKMIHNGIEYGMMQALAEGFALMQGKPDLHIDLGDVAKLWQNSSVIRSWLLDLTADALEVPNSLAAVAPHVSDSGEGRWTVDEAIRQGTPAPVIAMALMSRFDSQGKADTANRLLSLMRQGFGGHAVVAAAASKNSESNK